MSSMQPPQQARRIVVKLGSNVIAQPNAIDAALRMVAALRRLGAEVVLVSSGAVRLGMETLGMTQRPSDLPRLQAAASVGQSRLMEVYGQRAGAHGLKVGQVLLVHADFGIRERFLNARAAAEAMIDLDVVPIVNENDAVGTSEIEFGDNDQLATLVANLVEADLLVLLTSVDGVLDAHGQPVAVLTDRDAALALVQEGLSRGGIGGMGSKLRAAFNASERGVPVIITSMARDDLADALMRGDDVGTLIPARFDALGSRKHWLAFSTKPTGVVVVDKGAVKALRHKGASLLAVGICGARGRFEAGDVVRIEDAEGRDIGRGIARFPLVEVCRFAASVRDKRAEAEAGERRASPIVVHRDDLVLFST